VARTVDEVGSLDDTVWRGPRHRTATVLAAILFIPVATLVQLWRVPGESAWRTVWFEDATIFYGDALELPLAETLAKPYNGYAHALPRILATIGTWLRPEWYSAWAAVSSTVVVSLLALFLYFASAPLLRAPLRRGVFAVSLLVLPVLSLEVVAALCNLQWFVPIACVFAVLFPVDGWGGIAVRALIVVLAPLTSPLCLAATPFALYQLGMFVRRRDRWRRFVVPVLYLAACAGQLLVYIRTEQFPLGAATQPPIGDVLDDVADLYTVGVLIHGGFDTQASDLLWRSSSSWVGWAAAAAAMVLVVVKLARAESTARWWIAGFALASPAVFAFTMIRRSERIIPALALVPWDIRYWVVPQFLLLVALLVPPVVGRGLLLGSPQGADLTRSATTADTDSWWEKVTGGLPWVAVSVMTVLWLAVAVVPSYRHEVGRSQLASWPDQIDRAQAACRVDPTRLQVIEVAPPPPDWRLRMTCEEVGVGQP
jgi:hypothetical protein